MQFRTEISVPRFPFSISHESRMLSMGSCFSENVGKHFLENKFRICVNPFGQQYNPASVSGALHRLMNPLPYSETDLTAHAGLFHSFHHHSQFSTGSAAQTLQGINEQLEIAAEALQQADLLFITFGTAHVFRRKDTGHVVSNCHQLPASFFDNELLMPDAIVQEWTLLLNRLQEYNPQLQLIFTVSPVRYFAFGSFENSVSKAHLFTAISQLLKTTKHTHYFPAYEMLMDELRDYRFYNEDMIHPSAQAISFVWNRLCDSMMTADTRKIMEEVEAIRKAAQHRPRQPRSQAHRQFVEQWLSNISRLEAKLGLDFSAEKQQLSVAETE